jgi:alpha-amylase
MNKLSLRLSSFVALACASLPASGCMSFPEAIEEIPLTSQVGPDGDWRDEVIYQLLVDRFANGSAGNDFSLDPAPGKWHGGDWQGLEERLPYLENLGVTTLWISPVVKNVDTDAGFDAYHGYWAQDLTEPNPHFGDVFALRRLVAAAHERGMKVIFDIVTNHLGQVFYYDINLNGQPDERVFGNGLTSGVVHINEYDPDFDPRGVQAFSSLGEAGPAPAIFVYDPASNHMPPKPELFSRAEVYNRKGRTYNFDDPAQLLTGDFPGGLKDVDTTRCDVKKAMVDSYARWIELTDADGFRIDTVKHVEREFWRFFTQKVRQRLKAKGKDKFFMFGEAFDGRDDLVGSYTKNDLPSATDLARENECFDDEPIGGVASVTGDQLDSVFYFPQHFQAMRDVFRDGRSTKRLEDLWNARTVNYGTTPPADGVGLAPSDALVNFIDNHDVPRFLYESTPEALHVALAFTYTAPGIPCVYYGTEQRFAGGNDPANREDMWLPPAYWGDPASYVPYDEEAPTYRFMRRLGLARKASLALRRGDYGVVWASERDGDEPDAGVFAFERRGGAAGSSYALVVLNASKKHPSSPAFGGVPMAVNAGAGATLVDVLSPDCATQYVVGGDGRLAITLPSDGAAILVPAGELPAECSPL